MGVSAIVTQSAFVRGPMNLFFLLILVLFLTTIPLVTTHLQIDIPLDDGCAFHKLCLKKNLL